jgi:peptidase C39-like protein
LQSQRPLFRIALALTFLTTPLTAQAVGGPASSSSGADKLLAVPYLAQSERLCGGAAVAMVLRYWGEKDVFAQDFESSVERGAAGIRTSALVTAVTSRGWQAHVLEAGTDGMTSLRAEINRGRPIIAQIEERPGTFHYVVVVGSTGEQVVVHDPARAPFRVLTIRDFERAWSVSDRWMLRILPGDSRTTQPPVTPPDAPSIRATTACDALVAEGIANARASDHGLAERALLAATELCPKSAAAWRELAGLRFSQSRWHEVADLARRAVELAPDDEHAWELLASGRFLDRDLTGALRAWNRVGQPRTDVIEVLGIQHTPQTVVTGRLGIEPRDLLTPAGVERASARMRELPSASEGSVRYEPTSEGQALVRATLDERDVYPHGKAGWGAIGARAAVSNELRLEFTNLAASGEAWRGAWRWSANRPRVGFQLALPAPGWLPGIATLEASIERQAYRIGDGDEGVFRQSRRRAGLEFSDWATHWLRWRAGSAMDRFGKNYFLALDARLDARIGHGVVVQVEGGSWSARSKQQFWAGGIGTSWRSGDNYQHPVLSALAGYDITSRDAPLALWQGAGARAGRDVRLRGHLLFREGVLTGDVFGRRIAFGTIEYEHPVRMTRAGQVNIAFFVDSARAWRRLLDPAPSPLHVDLGMGVRFRPSGKMGGLRDGRVAISAGWIAKY